MSSRQLFKKLRLLSAERPLIPMDYKEAGSILITGGEGGIRTPGTGLGQYDGLANRCFRPLSHLSVGHYA